MLDLLEMGWAILNKVQIFDLHESTQQTNHSPGPQKIVDLAVALREYLAE